MELLWGTHIFPRAHHRYFFFYWKTTNKQTVIHAKQTPNAYIYLYILSLTVPFSCPHKFLSLINFIVIIGAINTSHWRNLYVILCDRVCVCVPLYRTWFSQIFQFINRINVQHMRAHTQCTIYEVFSRIILHNCSFLLINLGKSLCPNPCLLISVTLSLSLSLFLYLLSFIRCIFPTFVHLLRFLFTPQDCLIYCCSSYRVMINTYWSAAYVEQFDILILIKFKYRLTRMSTNWVKCAFTVQI